MVMNSRPLRHQFIRDLFKDMLQLDPKFETAALREIQEETGIGQLDRPRVLAITQHLDGPAAMVTAGVAVHVVRVDVQAQVREPHVFSQWDWFSLESLPTPLFPATAAVLACWRNAQTPAGWCSYAMAGMARS